MEKKTAAILGLIGGIIAAAGVFLPWASVTAFGITITASGWDARETVSYPYVVLLGGIIALLGGLAVLSAAKVKNIGYMMPLGGIVALLGWIWAATDVADWSVVSYGFYACLVGAILSLISGLGIKGK